MTAPFVAHSWQTAAIADFARLGGVFCAAQAGSGKTYVIAGCARQGARPVVLVRRSGLKQTKAKLESYGVTHAQFITYGILSRNPTLLAALNPDVLLCDEADVLKRVRKSAWARQVATYLHDNPATRVGVFTGSIMHKSVVDYAHFLAWALRKRSPAPRTTSGIERWALWADANPREWLTALRNTPGVYIDGLASWGGEITLAITRLPPAAPDDYERAQTTSTAPDGWVFDDKWSRDELLRQLSWGFYLARNPRPSPELIEARRVWARYVRQAIEYGHALTESMARSVYPDAYAKYCAVAAGEPAGEPTPEWLSDWGDLPEEWSRPGSIWWVHHGALGERLSAEFGYPYHREGTLDATGLPLREQTAPVVIASISACHREIDGLQHRYDHNVILEPQQDARIYQQLLARTARQGRDVSRSVSVEVVLRCPEHERAFTSALEQARTIEESTGQEQLLLRARKIEP